ncbi:MAG: glycosyltransferase [Oscillospiraceae bacterium]|nr:glycosyltransferase [Oscillospiraceae bacterium]
MKRAIITTYYPSTEVKSNILGICGQVDEVIICDNSPKENSELFTFECSEQVKYVWFGENRGLSRAFNTVLKDDQFAWSDDDYIIYFDQDSSISDGHIGRMISEFDALRAAGHPVGCIGPVFYNTSNGTEERPKQRTPLSDNSYIVASIITSSMLCTYGNMRKIDFWNENIFLDMADWDICWRMQAAGMLCCMTEVAVLKHSLGNGEKKIGPIRLRVGSAFREYYQIRECLHLLFRSYTPFKFRIRFLAMLFVRSPLHLLFLDHRKERIKYIALGIRDFFKKEHGELKR